nr:3'-5' exonuclease [Vibrio sonorensis]
MAQLFNYVHPLSRMLRRRKRYYRQQALPSKIGHLVSLPNITHSTLVSEVEYLVLDIETTGLDPNQDNILSIGWVVVAKGCIEVNSSYHCYIKDNVQVKPETAVINHITPNMLAKGISIQSAMNQLFRAARNRVLVAHCSAIESAFILRYLTKFYGLSSLPLLWLDTLQIEKNLATAINRHQKIDVELTATRSRYCLPEYVSHNALTDALSTAELLLAQIRRVQGNKPVALGMLYSLSEVK